ncbi:hypothetical protein NDU88_011694 [Pleurodeles waltl]|uniref:Uncharacterized protein n=1 Tax=Pleurodeles waltl TaxID=8319 RepID=A0AAV7QY02_PLEWA|nr:hypothetical protein NDU88_011694 [Pleurodeles waltl]
MPPGSRQFPGEPRRPSPCPSPVPRGPAQTVRPLCAPRPTGCFLPPWGAAIAEGSRLSGAPARESGPHRSCCSFPRVRRGSVLGPSRLQGRPGSDPIACRAIRFPCPLR